jgi:hypothetical protein
MVWWLLKWAVALVGGGWGTALSGFGQAVIAATSLPGMALFMLRGAMTGDLTKALRLLVGAFVVVALFRLAFNFWVILDEEDKATEKGCIKWLSCSNLAEEAKNDPDQVRLCDQWKKTCQWNKYTRAADRFTDIFPTKKELSENLYYQVLAFCFIAAVSTVFFPLTGRCLGWGKKFKKKKDAREAHQFQQAWANKAASQTFPVA